MRIDSGPKWTQTNRVLWCGFGNEVYPSDTHCDSVFPNHSRTSPNHPRSHQKVPKSCIWEVFLLLGFAKRFFFIVPSPNLGPILFNPNPSTQIRIVLANGFGIWHSKLWIQIANPSIRIQLGCKVQPSSHHESWPTTDPHWSTNPHFFRAQQLITTLN